MGKLKHFFINIIIGVLISFVIFYIFLLIDMNILIMAVCFVIPAGGIIFGMILGYLAKKGLIKDQASCGGIETILLICISIALLIALTFFDYSTCYVDDAGELNRVFRGDHISNYVLEEEVLDFPTYFRLSYVNAEMSLSFKGNRSNQISIGQSPYSLIVYGLQYIVMCICSILVAKTVNNMPRCPICTKYYKEKEIERYINETSVKDVLTSFLTKINSQESFTSENLGKTDYYYSIKAHYCPDCGRGMASIMQRTGRGRSERITFVTSAELNSDQLRKLRLFEESKKHEAFNNEQGNQPVLLSRNSTISNVASDNDEKALKKEKGSLNSHKDLDDKSMEQLRKLKQLFDEGILSEEEFQKKKDQILNS